MKRKYPGKRWCTRCQMYEPIAEFDLEPKNKSGFKSYCRESFKPHDSDKSKKSYYIKEELRVDDNHIYNL